MKLLLDTCPFLWIVLGDRRLSARARALFEAPEHEVWLSAASAWEIAVKYQLGRLPLPQAPDRFVPAMRAYHQIDALPIDEESVLQAARLPALHRDPFDRLLVGQAIAGGLTLVTPDDLIAQYPIRVMW